MNIAHSKSQPGSVLIITLLTITILTLICATTLFVASQNQNTAMQTASWQQALAGAESGIDRAVRALNTTSWSGWYNVSGSLPASQPAPSGTPNASAAPTTGQYNYFATSSGVPALTLSGISGTTDAPEGNTKIWGWVTVDPALTDSGGKQYYRVRSTGMAGTTGLFRASMNRLDNDLRNSISLRFDRKSGAALTTAQATRSIEVIMQPILSSMWVRAVTLQNQIIMSGGSFIDSFDSSSPFKSTSGLYDIAKRQSNGDVGTLDSTSSDLKNMFVYGDMAYSGPAVKNATNVQGVTSTPFTPSVSPVSAPTWTSYTDNGSLNGSATLPAGTKASPTKYKYSSLTVPGGGILTITAPNSGTDDNYIEIWVTGKLTTSGSGLITLDPKVKTTIYVGDDITVSGQSFNNQSGLAANVNIIGYGPVGSKVTDSGGGHLIATVNAPNYAVTISGSGSFSGALIANTLNLSGSGGLHYDESLNAGGSSSSVGNYAFASWFEDNSDAARGITY